MDIHRPNLQTLASWTIFKGVSTGTLEEMLHNCRLQTLQRGESLFVEGDKTQAVYLVVAGDLRLSRQSEHGHMVILQIAMRGEIMGVSALSSGVYPADCAAMNAVTVMAVPASVFTRLAVAEPTLAANVMTHLSSQLVEAQRRFTEVASEPVEQRLARTVLRLVEQSGVHVTTGWRLCLPSSRESLAEMCATTAQTVSRILSDWHKAGLVDTRREEIVVIDRSALANWTHDHTYGAQRLK